MFHRIAPAAFAIVLSAFPTTAETIAVFTPGDEGRPFIDVYASGLYSATCVDGAGCTCAALPIDRAEMAVVLGLASVPAGTQGIWDSPASAQTLTDETTEALHARFGGSGYCPQTALEPADGQWRDGKPFNISVQCGPASEMFRQVLSDSETVTTTVVWNGVFSGTTFQAAYMAAAPDLDYTPHAFRDMSPVETIGTAQTTTEMGPVTSTGRMLLLTPSMFSVNWVVKGTSEMGPCNWSITYLVTRVAP